MKLSKRALHYADEKVASGAWANQDHYGLAQGYRDGYRQAIRDARQVYTKRTHIDWIGEPFCDWLFAKWL